MGVDNFSSVVTDRMVWCHNRFVAFHYWPNPPEKYKYLGVPHRHEFHALVAAHVDHAERDVEFQELKSQVDCCVANYKLSSFDKPLTKSCETMAEEIGFMLRGLGYKIHFVEVSEDGENGASVRFR